MLDVEKRLGDAVKHFWTVRVRQHRRQGAKTGKKDAGSRGAVTGGRPAFIRPTYRTRVAFIGRPHFNFSGGCAG